MSRKALISLVIGVVLLSVGVVSSAFGSPLSMGGGALLATAWFDGDVENLTWPSGDETTLAVDDGRWTNGGGALANGATYEVDHLLDTSMDLAFEPTAAVSADFNTLTINATVMFEAYEFDGGTYPEVPANSKGAVSVFVVEETNATNYYFYGLAKTGTTNGWVRLTGGNAESVVGVATPVAIRLTYDVNADIVVNYAVDETVLQYNGKEDIPFEGNGLPNVNVASVGLKNAVEVYSVDGSYDENNFDPTVDFGGYSQVQGVNFTSNTLTFTINSVTTNRNIGTITYGVTWNGKSYTAEKSDSGWTVKLTDPSDFAASKVIENLDINIYYHPYGSNDAVRVTNSVGKVTIFQGAADYEAVAWIAAAVEDSAVVSTGGSWDVTPEVSNGKMAFEDECVFTANNAATLGRGVLAETVIEFSEPNDLKVSFDGMGTVPHGAFTLVQTVGDDPEAVGAQFRFAYYGADGWETNASYEAALNTEYTITVEFDYAEGKAYFSASNNTTEVAAELGSVNINREATLMKYVGFLGAGLVESFHADEMKPVADASLVEDALGNKFANLGDALACSNDVLKLLWNQTFTPTGEGKAKITAGKYTLQLMSGHREEVGEYSYFSVGSDYVAEACGTNFFALVAAFDTTKSKTAVAGGADPDVVTLLTNLCRTVEVASDRSFVFDLNNLSVTTNTESGVTNVFVIAGDLVITNSAQDVTAEGSAGGEGAIVKGTIIVKDSGSLDVCGGYFAESIDSWINGDFSASQATIEGVKYNTVVIILGDPLFIFNTDPVKKCYTQEQADNFIRDETAAGRPIHPTNIVLIVGLTASVSNGVDVLFSSSNSGGSKKPLTEELNQYLGFSAIGFVISNTTDECKYILVEKEIDEDNITNLVADITTRDEYAYEGLTIGGVALSKLMGGALALSNYVEITDAFIAPFTTVTKVKTDLLKAREQKTGSNGLSLFANWVLGIPVEGTTKGTDDIYDDHDGQPLMSIPTLDGAEVPVGGSDNYYLYLPFSTFGWSDIYDAIDRADTLDYELQVSLYNVTSGTRSGLHGENGEADPDNATPICNIISDDMLFHIPKGDAHYRIDLLIDKKPAE